MQKWTRAFFQPNLPLKDGQRVTACKEHIALSKEAAAEGMVLLKNQQKLLPLPQGSRLALFGKGSFDYVKGGGGSGDVTVSYTHNLYDGLKMQADRVTLYEPLSDFYRENVRTQYEEGAVPGMTVEPALPDALLAAARAFTDTALITISRFSGEGWDRSDVEYDTDFNPWGEGISMPGIAGKIFERGDFYLTRAEETMVAQVKKHFDKIIVVLNVGGMVDCTWFQKDAQLSSVLLAWQGGMEGGLAAAEILCGKVTPSGKLPDTLAAGLECYSSTANFHESPHYVDYTEDIYVGYRYFETIPGAADKVCYPFGFGLSYTSFSMAPKQVWEDDNRIHIAVQVTNTGDCAGKEVVQVYYSAPQGLLGKPARQLCAFAKTKLLQPGHIESDLPAASQPSGEPKRTPGESQLLVLSFAKEAMASYDDLGKVAKSTYVLEKGTYTFYVGNSVRDAVKLDFTFTLPENVITEQLASHMNPTSLKERMLADGSFEALPQSAPNEPNACIFPKMEPGTEESIVPEIKHYAPCYMRKRQKEGARPFMEVAEGKMTLEEFMAQLSDDDLIHLLGGQPNTSVSNTFGLGNLPEYGIPTITTADGPAGLRIVPECCVATTAFPCATLLASTWNPELVEQVGQAGAEEVKENNIGMWLTPAVNIHRNPMCGRNFEYYSEDPYLTGKMGAAMVRGIQSQHIAATVKHFACNNKETNRKHSDSRLSERALREIYLKGFEIIVKEADPWAIMSSYNVINGHRASESRELLEDILREEWGFRGMVTTDWWTRGEHYKEILAGNDLKMACGFPERVKQAMELGAVNRADLERCAKRVLELILKID